MVDSTARVQRADGGVFETIFACGGAACGVFSADASAEAAVLDWPTFGRFVTGMSAAVSNDDIFVDAIVGMFQVDEKLKGRLAAVTRGFEVHPNFVCKPD